MSRRFLFVFLYDSVRLHVKEQLENRYPNSSFIHVNDMKDALRYMRVSSSPLDRCLVFPQENPVYISNQVMKMICDNTYSGDRDMQLFAGDFNVMKQIIRGGGTLRRIKKILPSILNPIEKKQQSSFAETPFATGMKMFKADIKSESEDEDEDDIPVPYVYTITNNEEEKV